VVLAPAGVLDVPALRDDGPDARVGAAVRAVRLPGGDVSVVVRVVPQFREASEAVALAKVTCPARRPDDGRAARPPRRARVRGKYFLTGWTTGANNDAKWGVT